MERLFFLLKASCLDSSLFFFSNSSERSDCLPDEINVLQGPKSWTNVRFKKIKKEVPSPKTISREWSRMNYHKEKVLVL